MESESSSAELSCRIYKVRFHLINFVCVMFQEEHEGIISRREDENSEVTWEEYKSMTFTHMVS